MPQNHFCSQFDEEDKNYDQLEELQKDITNVGMMIQNNKTHYNFETYQEICI